MAGLPMIKTLRRFTVAQRAAFPTVGIKLLRGLRRMAIRLIRAPTIRGDVMLRDNNDPRLVDRAVEMVY
jgi:hypothetical protein